MTGFGIRAMSTQDMLSTSMGVVTIGIVLGEGKGWQIAPAVIYIFRAHVVAIISFPYSPESFTCSGSGLVIAFGGPDVVEGLAAWFWLHIRVPLL